MLLAALSAPLSQLNFIHALNGYTVSLMGLSFLLGAIFTLLLLLVLDWIRASQQRRDDDLSE